MSDMDDINERLDNHEDRIKSLEDTRVATLKALSDLDGKHEQRLRDVKNDLQHRIVTLDTAARERDDANSKRLDRFEGKIDGMNGKLDSTLESVRKAPPAWVGPLIGGIIAIAGWLINRH